MQYSASHAIQVKNVLGRRLPQAKLSIGQANDRFEQEADRVADQVMRMPVSARSLSMYRDNSEFPLVQRMCPECEEEVRRQPEEDEEEMLQASAAPGGLNPVRSDLAQTIQCLRGGRPLAAAERNFFEHRFGHDFSNVRVHSDHQAAKAASAVNAKAFTLGRNLVFGAGMYAPHTKSGKRLLAHELTHVIQQSGTTSNVDSIQRKCESEFPCIRTPIPPGQGRFNNCSSQQLSDYAVIPETGTTLVTPANNVWYDTDGLWYRHHVPRDEWFKIPGHCDVEIHCKDRDFTCSKCCNLTATTIFGNPRWTSDAHGTTNPFV
jgi:hypothetical protein